MDSETDVGGVGPSSAAAPGARRRPPWSQSIRPGAGRWDG